MLAANSPAIGGWNAGPVQNSDRGLPVHRGIHAATAEKDSEVMANEGNRWAGGKWSQGPDEEAELRVEAHADGNELVVGRAVAPAAEKNGPGVDRGPGLPLPAGLSGSNVH